MSLKKIFQKSELYFQPGTEEQFRLHEFLLISNILLSLIMIFEFYAEFSNKSFPQWLHNVELFFGVIFLFELILYLIHVYIPNKVFFQPFLWINAFVTVSLLFPEFLGNLAILRLLRTISVLKVYQYNKKIKELNKNLNFEFQSIKLIKITITVLIINPVKKVLNKKQD